MVTEQLIPDLLPVADDWDISAVQILAFDLDDTLAPSKSQVPAPIADALVACLAHWQVCIISGGRFEQFQHQVLDHLVAPDELLDRLHLMPTCGTQYYRWGNPGWTKLYSEDLSQEQKDRIVAVLTDGAHELGLWETTTWGGPGRGPRQSGHVLRPRAGGRRSTRKRRGTPRGEKRSKLRSYAADRLPGLEVRSGGSTSIDVTPRGHRQGLRHHETADPHRDPPPTTCCSSAIASMSAATTIPCGHWASAACRSPGGSRRRICWAGCSVGARRRPRRTETLLRQAVLRARDRRARRRRR